MLAEPVIVDARGLLCPMPVIRVQDAIAGMSPGAEVHLLATDPGVQADVPAWCRVHGHRVEAVLEEGDTLRVCIRVRD
ncbi:sulfurtransferase TusA family protein [Aquisalimonas sp.]|uniref:sulfurtransferase TusA family protein n=1 Tax=unclassified Aquisalimonas TaxID=2644645 RepID=UPI0025B9F141|nr:sulfurtransferase TusA family protein [Aquisalimonas sp.]